MATQSKAIVDKLLTGVSQKVMPEGYIADLVLPEAKVVQYSGKIGRYGKDHLRIESTVVGGRGEFPLVETNTRSSDSYALETHGLKDILTPEDYANVEQPFDAERDSTEDLTTKLALGKEKGLADALTSTSIITNNLTLSNAADKYSDYANSDPLGDFATARASIHAATGTRPDTAIISWSVYNVIRYHPSLLRNLGFADQRAGGLSLDELAKVMEVKRVLVGEAVYNSAKQGKTAVMEEVWGKHIVFLVAPTKPAKRQVTVGYRLTKAGTAIRQVFKNDKDEPPESKLIQVRDIYQQLITDAGAAYLIKNAVN